MFRRIHNNFQKFWETLKEALWPLIWPIFDMSSKGAKIVLIAISLAGLVLSVASFYHGMSKWHTVINDLSSVSDALNATHEQVEHANQKDKGWGDTFLSIFGLVASSDYDSMKEVILDATATVSMNLEEVQTALQDAGNKQQESESWAKWSIGCSLLVLILGLIREWFATRPRAGRRGSGE